MSKRISILTGLVILVIVAACSTEKNTLLSRSYHSTTAHYNGYFNANDLLSGAMKSYRESIREDYYNVLPVAPLPNEEEVKTMYTPIDTAIAKCTKVIQKHAMPGTDKPSKKKEEHNKWIDENWTTIGIANYYRRDYTLAMRNFEYVQKFFSNDKSTYVAEIWMAKTNIAENRMTEAGFNLANLDKAVEETENGTYKKTKGKKGKKGKKEVTKAPFPKKLRYELEITRALYYEKKQDKDNTIKALEAAVKYAKKSSEKARLHFVLGQLYEKKSDGANAALHFDKSLKYNGTYEMNFNARLRRALNGGGNVEKDLNKLLHDEKNTEFKDQIYYTLGLIAQNQNDENKAISHFTNSAFYSTTNNRQKGMAYERLGDLSFAKKDYVKAQKYYDSCATVIPENYPNREGVQNKALKLQDLVIAIETAHYEDSVQRVVAMSEEDRLELAEKLVKKIKDDEARRKEQEAIRARELQNMAAKAAAGSGNKWYWNNPKAKQEGFDEFKRQWGQRINEDDWRRSEKIVLSFAATEEDTLNKGNNDAKNTEIAVDSLTPEFLLAKLPLSDSALTDSKERMMAAYFDAGRIYQDQLNENKLAEKQYNTILEKPFESKYKLLSAYQIYKMYDPNAPEAQTQKNYILTNYPTSDFAGYLRDPDYFLKKKEREKLAEQEYLSSLDRYERGIYYPALLKADAVITQEKENKYRSKYYLLKAKCQAKLNEDKKVLLPTLDSLIAEYPGTDEAKHARQMRDIIVNGYSTNTEVDFNKASIYKYKEKEEMNVLVFLDEKMSSSMAKTRVSDFNKEFFGREKLATSSKIFGKQSVILVKTFANEDKAAMYVAQFKKTKKHLLDLQKAKILYISDGNLKTLFETMKLEEYELFFDEKY